MGTEGRYVEELGGVGLAAAAGVLGGVFTRELDIIAIAKLIEKDMFFCALEMQSSSQFTQSLILIPSPYSDDTGILTQLPHFGK